VPKVAHSTDIGDFLTQTLQSNFASCCTKSCLLEKLEHYSAWRDILGCRVSCLRQQNNANSLNDIPINRPYYLKCFVQNYLVHTFWYTNETNSNLRNSQNSHVSVMFV